MLLSKSSIYSRLIINFPMQKLFSFQGRISRSKFWLFGIGISLVVSLPSALFIPALAFMGFSSTVALMGFIFLCVLTILGLIISVATGVKRFHDRDKSGWWILIALIPVIGFFWILVECGFLKGTTGANSFGEDPLQLHA